jgi:hypothetical protein
MPVFATYVISLPKLIFLQVSHWQAIRLSLHDNPVLVQSIHLLDSGHGVKPISGVNPERGS